MKKAAEYLLKIALGLIVAGLLLFGYWLLARAFRGEEFVRISTGHEQTFTLKKGQPLKFHDVNTGFGSSPGMIDPDKGVYLYQPNGELCVLDQSAGNGHYFGDFEAPVAGTYRFVLDALERVQSRGALIAHDTLPFRGPAGWLAILGLVVSGPMAFLGGLFWILAPKEKPAQTPPEDGDPVSGISAREDVMRRFEGRN